jgi:hypothetical protein
MFVGVTKTTDVTMGTSSMVLLFQNRRRIWPPALELTVQTLWAYVTVYETTNRCAKRLFLIEPRLRGEMIRYKLKDNDTHLVSPL